MGQRHTPTRQNRDMNVFLVGSGSVGKTTVGPLVADLVGLPFIDLDERFIEQIGMISDYINEHGYRGYAVANADLAEQIVNDDDGNLVMATSSGFLVHDGCDDVAERNLGLIHRTGISVLLLPSEDVEQSARTLAFRQMARYPERDLIAEYCIALDRCGRYQTLADHVVLAGAEQGQVAMQIVELLAARSFDVD